MDAQSGETLLDACHTHGLLQYFEPLIALTTTPPRVHKEAIALCKAITEIWKLLGWVFDFRSKTGQVVQSPSHALLQRETSRQSVHSQQQRDVEVAEQREYLRKRTRRASIAGIKNDLHDELSELLNDLEIHGSSAS